MFSLRRLSPASVSATPNRFSCTRCVACGFVVCAPVLAGLCPVDGVEPDAASGVVAGDDGCPVASRALSSAGARCSTAGLSASGAGGACCARRVAVPTSRATTPHTPSGLNIRLAVNVPDEDRAAEPRAEKNTETRNRAVRKRKKEVRSPHTRQAPYVACSLIKGRN